MQTHEASCCCDSGGPTLAESAPSDSRDFAQLESLGGFGEVGREYAGLPYDSFLESSPPQFFENSHSSSPNNLTLPPLLSFSVPLPPPLRIPHLSDSLSTSPARATTSVNNIALSPSTQTSSPHSVSPQRSTSSSSSSSSPSSPPSPTHLHPNSAMHNSYNRPVTTEDMKKKVTPNTVTTPVCTPLYQQVSTPVYLETPICSVTQSSVHQASQEEMQFPSTPSDSHTFQFPFTTSSPSQPQPASGIYFPLTEGCNFPVAQSVILDDYQNIEGSIKRKNPRKKRKLGMQSSDQSSPNSFTVQLPKDVLLTISSSELQEYAQHLQASRHLSAEEQKELKRQKRLVKNRESALLSRQRKREQVSKLEGIIKNLSVENALLRTETGDLKNSLEQLKHENADLHATLARLQASGTCVATTQPPPPTKNLRVAGVCLLIVLFSFGLVLNARDTGDGEINLVALTQKAVPPDTGTKTASEKVGRVLLETEEDKSVALTEYKEMSPTISVSKPVVPAQPKPSEEQHLPAPKPAPATTSPVALPLARISTPAQLQTNGKQSFPSASSESSWHPKNMTYLVCNDVVRLDPPFPGCSLSPDNPKFAVVLPHAALSTSTNPSKPQTKPHFTTNKQTTGSSVAHLTDTGDLVEIMCNLVAVEDVPRSVVLPTST